MGYILELLATTVISIIENTRYAGIFVLMALESANIPIPSEIIMPFAGFLVWEEKLSFLPVVLWGALGNLFGSLVSYYLGFFGGRPFLERYGKFFLLKESDLRFADKFFQRYGSFAIFIGKVLPVVRTFISFPAGVARMNIWKFSAYTIIASFIWSYLLAYAGLVMGENWETLGVYFKKFDWAIGILFVAGLLWWIRRHFKKS